MILGLESSCDESAVSIVDREGQIHGEWIHSQIAKHAEYGGVVPDLAVGEHLKNFFLYWILLEMIFLFQKR